jgi:hypothetical protein
LAAVLAFSSDSTTHRKKNYDSRCIITSQIDEETGATIFHERTMGITTSVSHSSEEQLAGTKQRLTEIGTLFSNSPFAKEHGLKFVPDDFAYKLGGTSGDHAADQLKVHAMMTEWKAEVTERRLGEEAILDMHVGDAFLAITQAINAKMREMGVDPSQCNVSERQSIATSAADDLKRELGRGKLAELPEEEQRRQTRVVRTGCSMHKDLNTFKYGDKAIQAFWKAHGLTPPIYLPNKDNAAVLGSNAGSESSPEGPAISPQLAALIRRAGNLSGQGATKTTTLVGLVVRNPDTKKGQQILFGFYMHVSENLTIVYPDVSNTRYGSHGAACVLLLAHTAAFMRFMLYVQYKKDTPGLTNIEKNIVAALQDGPTLTEIAVLALYFLAVSRPFMAYVREGKKNMLDLGSYFQKKREFLVSIQQSPDTWLSKVVAPGKATLDGHDWQAEPALIALHERLSHGEFPHVRACIVAFMTGAIEGWDNFTSEFAAGGIIDGLTPTERLEIFMPTTNDRNEGGLGSWRVFENQNVGAELEKFNGNYKTVVNGTESFINNKLSSLEDQRYLREQGRLLGSSGLAKKRKHEQIAADKVKAEENKQKELKRTEQDKAKAAALAETSQKLCFDEAELWKLSKDEQIAQIEFYRHHEKQLKLPKDKLSVQAKSHYTNAKARVEIIKRAAELYRTQLEANPSTIPSTAQCQPQDVVDLDDIECQVDEEL